MAEMHLIILGGDDLELAGRIMKKVKDVQTIEAAVKWALRECSSKWPESTNVEIEWEPVITMEENGGIAFPPLEPTAHPEPAPRIPVGRHYVLNIPLKDLATFPQKVVVGSETLGRLLPDGTDLDNVLSGAQFGTIKF